MGMFKDCRSLKKINLRGLNASKVTSMERMFERCRALTSINLSVLKTSKVESLMGMFKDCRSLKKINLRRLKTGKYICMNEIFSGCSSLNSIDLSSLDTSSINHHAGMFMNSSVSKIALGSNTVSLSTYRGPWKRVKMLNGSSANGPVINTLHEYTGSAPGWYEMIDLTNPINAKGNTVKIKYKKLKKKNITIKRANAIKVTKAQGKVTYKLTGVKKAKFKKYFKVKKNGNITVKKKLKKGSYKLKIKVMAAGNVQYKKAAKTTNVSIKVK